MNCPECSMSLKLRNGLFMELWFLKSGLQALKYIVNGYF